MEKYTATIYTNNYAIRHQSGDNLTNLIGTLMVQLEGCLSGSHGIIRDNALDMIIQRYKKDVIED